MLELLLSSAVGIAVAIAWMATWTIIFRALGIPVFKRGPQERASRKERILQMGKLRYILVFGVLGYGFAFGLGVAIAGADISRA